jgi:predicted O-methyltransferase YrrM
MGRYNDLIDPKAIDYVLKNSVRETDLLARLRRETASHPNARFQVPPEQGQLLQVLVRMLGARRTIEVGVFTGYSSLAVALVLPSDGQIIACDISDEYTSVARSYWAEADVAGKIDLRVGPASETLDRMIAAGESGRYDFAFIDADKTGYPGYYEQCLTLVRPGGLIALDNMLQSGQVMDDAHGENQDANVAVIRKLNEFIHGDERVDALLLPFGDGLTLAVRRDARG